MKKILLVVFGMVLCHSYPLKAEVVFLPNAEESVGSTATAGGNNTSCLEAGYTYTTCSGKLVEACPSNGNYYKICCPAGYLYERKFCGADISSDNCHGYYKCTPNETGIQARCAAEGYDTKNSCINHVGAWYDEEPCPYDSRYIKCT